MNRSREATASLRALYRVLGPVCVVLFIAAGQWSTVVLSVVVTMLAWFDQ